LRQVDEEVVYEVTIDMSCILYMYMEQGRIYWNVNVWEI
jgi:hypothetical protein